MGFLDRIQNRAHGTAPAGAPNPPGRPSSLPSFGSYASKAQFMVDWARSIFREAGQEPDAHVVGVQDMANIAAFSQIWFRFRSSAENARDHQLAAYLDALDRQSILSVLDTMYPTALDMMAASNSGSQTAASQAFVDEFDEMFDRAFLECRAEFVGGVRAGDF